MAIRPANSSSISGEAGFVFRCGRLSGAAISGGGPALQTAAQVPSLERQLWCAAGEFAKQMERHFIAPELLCNAGHQQTQ
jgi:hypothetical protein